MNTHLNPVQTLSITAWDEPISSVVQTESIEALENGQLLFLPHLSFEVQPEEQYLISPVFSDKKAKNISLDSQRDQLKGALGTSCELLQIKKMIARFANQANQLVQSLLPQYYDFLQVARTSLRPVQITQRKMSYRKDDRRLHVDAFVATPNQGRRILRVFSNINLHDEPRVWLIGEPFENVAQHFLPQIPKPIPGSAHWLQRLKITKSRRTEYDHIMLQLHNRMKKDLTYQQTVQQMELHFPPGTTWIVQTDQVSHAALSGQHLLEQTFYLPVQAMLNPERSPLKILERLTGRTLV